MENQTEDCIKQFLINFSEQIKEAKLSEHEKYLIEQSKQAFYLNEDLEKELSDEELIQSECEESHVDWGTIHDPLQAEAKDIISKRVKSICLKAKRNAAKKIAEARFLRPKTVGRILKECPDIGKMIESYVKSAGVGADSWRRTGLLTFDGDRKLKKKATFASIKAHLESVYNRKFGYGSGQATKICQAV